MPVSTLRPHILVEEPVQQHGKVLEVNYRVLVQVGLLRPAGKSYVVEVGLSVVAVGSVAG